MYKPTNHFLQRWTEYYPDQDWEHQLKYSSIPKGITKKRIKQQCPKNAHKMTRDGKYFYLINNGKTIVFVCSADRAVITVFPYEKGERKERFFGILQDKS